jgi:uncharacterized membrane protein YbaN (DUF454 family)
MIGPVFTDNILLIFIGLAINGVAISGIFVPVIPELISAIQV